MILRNPKYIFGISGPAQFGKTTAGNFLKEALEENHGIKAVVIPMGDALKEELSEMYRIPRWKFDDPDYKEDLRPLMHAHADVRKNSKFVIDTAAAHQISLATGEPAPSWGYPLYWAHLVMARFYHTPYDTEALIIPDMRYNFNIKYFKEIPAIRPTYRQQLHIVSPDAAGISTSHHSEDPIDVDLVTYVLKNPHAKGLEVLKRHVAAYARMVVTHKTPWDREHNEA